MTTILDIIEEVAATTKSTEKLAILSRHKDNKTLARVADYALNPFKKYYIRIIPKYETNPVATLSLDEAITGLDELISRRKTGHAASNHLALLLSSLTIPDATVIIRIIGGDLRCGANVATFNKVFPKLIPTYPVLLAEPYSSKTRGNIKFPAYVELKEDGMRINISKDDAGEIIFVGRSGKQVDLLGVLDDEMQKLFAIDGDDAIYDGEIIVVDENGVLLHRKKSNGILNKANKGTLKKEEAFRIRIRLWDKITKDDFNKRVSKDMYSVRSTSLSDSLGLANLTKVSKVEQWIVNSWAEIDEIYATKLSENKEGVMVKNADTLWEDCRSKFILKLKSEIDIDLEIVGWNPGEGKYAGMVGSLICETCDGKIRVNVSGFKDPVRKYITDNIALFIGKIIEVRYQEIINSEQSSIWSLSLPRFRRHRPDKQDASPMPVK